MSKDVSFSELSSIIPSLYDIVKRMEYITSDAMISPTEGKVPLVRMILLIRTIRTMLIILC